MKVDPILWRLSWHCDRETRGKHSLLCPIYAGYGLVLSSYDHA